MSNDMVSRAEVLRSGRPLFLLDAISLADIRNAFYSQTTVNPLTDTIAAISTAPGKAGIAIIRISGPLSIQIADKIFRCEGAKPSSRPHSTFVHGFVQSESKDIDEAILLIFRAPNSYTMEDVVEIHGHGGRICAQRILNAALNAGARPAEPGEFTKRAFLNGRIDLLQAEAVADLIAAQSDKSAMVALEQLEGSLSCCLSSIYTDGISVAADIEASLDFADNELPEAVFSDIAKRLKSVSGQIKDLLESWRDSRILREGALVAIAGPPNAGKSTLMNSLLGSDRSIVSEHPGTTRDTIEEQLILNGIPFRLVDTAGLRSSACAIENEGIKRANNTINRADLVLFVIDSSIEFDSEMKEILKTIPMEKILFVLNKIDLGKKIRPAQCGIKRYIECSLIKQTGLQDLKKEIFSAIGWHEPANHLFISERHRFVLQNVFDAMNAAYVSLSNNREDELVITASNIRSALEQLGTLTGRVYSNELLDNIFQKFCIGK